MGWRFKKPINFGGFRLNLSKKGLGFSWGFPTFRTGVSADGRRYVWLTIPRTGVSWVKYFGKTSGQPKMPSVPSPPSNPLPPQPSVLTSTSPNQAIPPSNTPSNQIPWWKQNP